MEISRSLAYSATISILRTSHALKSRVSNKIIFLCLFALKRIKAAEKIRESDYDNFICRARKKNFRLSLSPCTTENKSQWVNVML